MINFIKKKIRILTAFIRISPDFLIIGAARSGTTSVFKYLNEHPQTLLSQKKEPNYFSFNYGRFKHFLYKSYFPLIFKKFFLRILRHKKIISGEASTYYLFYPHTPERVFHKYPKIKIIILLRNPIDRAYSHYNQNVKLNRETKSFEHAIINEGMRLENELVNLKKDKYYDSDSLHFFSYLERGKYFHQINRWLKYFPENQIKILLSDDFFSCPQKTYSEILNFLDISNFELKNHKVYNRVTVDSMNKETRTNLERYFQSSNNKLFKLLKRKNIWDSENLISDKTI